MDSNNRNAGLERNEYRLAIGEECKDDVIHNKRDNRNEQGDKEGTNEPEHDVLLLGCAQINGAMCKYDVNVDTEIPSRQVVSNRGGEMYDSVGVGIKCVQNSYVKKCSIIKMNETNIMNNTPREYKPLDNISHNIHEILYPKGNRHNIKEGEDHEILYSKGNIRNIKERGGHNLKNNNRNINEYKNDKKITNEIDKNFTELKNEIIIDTETATTTQNKINNTEQKRSTDSTKSIQKCLEKNQFEDQTNRIISVAQLNIAGLQQSKIIPIERVLNNKNVDILCLSESWKYFRAELPEIAGYKWWSSMRNIGKKGGTHILIKNSLKTSILNFPDPMTQIDQDLCWVMTTIEGQKYAIASVYIKPSTKEYKLRVLENLSQKIKICTQKGLRIILAGDFNLNYKKKEEIDIIDHFIWHNNGYIMNEKIESTQNYKYTRIPEKKRHEQPATLDYIITCNWVNERIEAFTDSKRETNIYSDHIIQIVRIITNEHKTITELPNNKILSWDMKEFRNPRTYTEKWREYTEYMENRTNNQIFTRDIERNYTNLHNIITETAISVVTKKEIKLQQNKQKREIKEVTKLRKEMKLQRKFLQNIKREPNQKYKEERTKEIKENIWKLNKQIKQIYQEEAQGKIESFIRKCEEDRPQHMPLYKLMKRYKHGNTETTHLEDKEGNIIEEDNQIKEALVGHLNNIFDKQEWPEAELQPPPDSLTINERSKDYLLNPFTIQELDTAIQGLRNGTSGGTTDILPEFLKHMPENTKIEMLIYFNEIYDKGIFPEKVETSRMICLHKKGATTDIGNYRTIATGCNICKVLLKMITNRIQEVAEENNLLGNIQRGFRKKQRGGENIIILETVLQQIKKTKKPHYVALLDITKAYDRVWREGLWYKLEKYGFPHKFINIIKASYKDSKAVLHYNNIATDPTNIELGLRQGGVMSPILFALYLADLGRVIEEQTWGVKLGTTIINGLFFADDMLLWGTKKNMVNLLKLMGEYSLTWKLEFSGPKSQIIPINVKPDKNKKWYLGLSPIRESNREEINIKETDEGKYLGVNFQRKMNFFTPHFENTIKKAWKNYWMIKHISSNLNNMSELAIKIWQTYAVPNIIYGLEYIGVPDVVINKLEKIQNTFIRSIYSLPQNTKNETLNTISGIPKLRDIILKLRWGFYTFMTQQKENRWSLIALRQQQIQAEQKNMRINIDRREEKGTERPKYPNFWETTVSMENKNKTGLVQGDPKHITKKKIEERAVEKHREIIQKSSCMNYIDPDNVIEKYHPHTDKFWLKTKTESLLLEYKNKNQENICLLCNDRAINIIHFAWTCTDINIEQIGRESRNWKRFCWLYNNNTKETNKEVVTWMLENNRNNHERNIIGEMLKERWKIREELLIGRQVSSDRGIT